MRKVTLEWRIFLVIALALGATFRLMYPQDIPYSNDQFYTMARVENVGKTEPWPWLGMPSGIQFKNPGMSVWVFLALSKLTGAQDPVSMARAVELLNVFALLLLLYFGWSWTRPEDRRLWFWAVALASVNSFAVMYHRYIWTQSVLPFFCVLILMAWWKRENRWASFALGVVGALIGQIHMSGFFFIPALIGWTFAFHRKSMRWAYWFGGSALGALPLIPWIFEILSHAGNHPPSYHWSEVKQFRFWVFWLTSPLGLHHGNAIGTLLGGSWWIQLKDYLRYPIVGGRETWIVAALHASALIWGVSVYALGIRALWQDRKRWKSIVFDRSTPMASFQSAVFYAYGVVLTLTSICIRRYYLIITFPFEWIFLARIVHRISAKRAHVWLGILFVLNAAMTLTFLHYIHVSEGGLGGEYGAKYGSQQPKSQ